MNSFENENMEENNKKEKEIELEYGAEHEEVIDLEYENPEEVKRLEKNLIQEEQTVSNYELDKKIEYLQANLKKQGRKRYISTALIGAILGSVITLGATYVYLPEILSSQGFLSNNQQQIIIKPSKDDTVYTAVAKKVMPSVVGITTVALQRDLFYGVRKVPGVGTGVIVDSRGYILTNSHVVGDGDVEEVNVIFIDGKQLKAEVLWNEKSLDLAIIKVEGNNFIAAELADSDETEVGEIAIAIGNPLGLTFERSLTQGVISGLNRTIAVDSMGETVENLMQTDASINPGNSGGPLLNAKGQVMGINTAKIAAGEGLGFAIPINTAKPIVDQFIEKGEFTRTYLGVQGTDIEVYEGITGNKADSEYGAYIVEVQEGSVAEKYGIRSNDIVIKMGDEKIKRMSNLSRTMYKYRPGDKTKITVVREGAEIDLEIIFD